MASDEVGALDRTLERLIGPALDRLGDTLAEIAEIAEIADLDGAEAAVLLDATRSVVLDAVRRKVHRLLVLELNAARLTGRLTAPDPAGRWEEFVTAASEPAFWQGLTGHYPAPLDRLRVVVAYDPEDFFRFAQSVPPPA